MIIEHDLSLDIANYDNPPLFSRKVAWRNE